MNSTGSKLGKALSSFMAAAVVLSVSRFAGAEMPVNADGERSLNGEASSFKITEILNSSDGDKDLIANPGSEVTYGDNITVKLEWEFLDTTSITTSDVFVYELPEGSEETPVSKIIFKDVNNTPIYDGDDVVGKFSISGNKILVQYTDETFCKQGSRHGSLSFVGNITDDGKGGTEEKDITINFDSYATLEIHMIPETLESALDVRKVFDETKTSSTDHIYNCLITITSTGENTNVQIDDGMYPGMYLYSAPEFYTDEACTTVLAADRYTVTSAETGVDKREVKATVDSMSDGEKIYMYYQVKVVDDLYVDWDTANEYVANHPYGDIYQDGKYIGRVPNRVTVDSDEIYEPVEDWDDIYTLNSSITKWSDAPENKTIEGKLCWEITVYSTNGKNITSGYILDTLPKNNSLDPKDVVVYDNDTGAVIENALDIKVAADGKTATFTFTSELLAFLEEDASHEALIKYYTKVVSQEPDSEVYENVAAVYFNGSDTPDRVSKASMTYTRPDPLSKVGEYTRTSAPNIEYVIFVNPASLDLDPLTDDLTLTDTMGTAYDLVLSTVTINGEAPDPDRFEYKPETHTMTFKLKDQKAYTIRYEGKVNLAPGSKLTEENCNNHCELFSENKQIFTRDKAIKSDVFQSAGSSSSTDNKGTLNVIKHDSSSVSDVLGGAVFTMTEMSMSDTYVVTSVSGTEKTTGTDGLATFTSMKRGVVYMLRETTAPDGYEKDDTPAFYVFAEAGKTYPANVYFNDTSYALVVISADKISNNIYVANTKEKTPDPSDPTDPTESSDPTESTDPTTATDPTDPTESSSQSSQGSTPVATTGELVSVFTVAGVVLVSGAVISALGYISLKKRKDQYGK